MGQRDVVRTCGSCNPNLSKDYLAGTAPAEWTSLRPNEFYAEDNIELRLGTMAKAIDVAGVILDSEETITFTKRLFATSAGPMRLRIPGADLPHVRTLRSLADSRAIIARVKRSSRVVIVGASFITSRQVEIILLSRITHDQPPRNFSYVLSSLYLDHHCY